MSDTDETHDGKSGPEEVPEYVEAWSEQTSALDRVISVALTLDRPRTAGWVADEAQVTEKTARSHLERLVELHALVESTAHGTTTYSVDQAYQRFTRLSSLVRKYDRRELEEMVVSAKEDIEEIQAEYDVESPDDLRDRAMADDTTADRTRELLEVASKMETTLSDLDMLRRAVEQYSDFTPAGVDGSDFGSDELTS